MFKIVYFLSFLFVCFAQKQLKCRNGLCEQSPDANYNDLCKELAEKQLTRDEIVIFKWTRPMLDFFHRHIKCTSETNPDCDVDDDWTATFQRACREPGTIPCLPDVSTLPTQSRAQYRYVETACSKWGLNHGCVVDDRMSKMTPEHLLNADVIMFEGTNNRVWNVGIYPPYKCENQFWTMYEFRPSSVYPFLRDPDYINTFDVTVGYSKNWTIWTPDFVPPIDFYTKISNEKNAENPVMAMMSQCNTPNERVQYMEELMKFINIDSYGKCLHNKDISEKLLAERNKYRQKAEIMKQYKFYLAFENSNEPDYVSEKIYNALSEGVVPVYMGANNIENYAPKGSFIKVSDFSSAENLANYLKELLNDQSKYDKYLEWKFRDPEPHMLELEKNSNAYHICQICDYTKKQILLKSNESKKEFKTHQEL